MSNSWNKLSSFNSQKRPSHLKGKQIGMFYRDRARMKKDRKEYTKKMENVITLKIPPLVNTQILKNLLNIKKIAKKFNIPISPMKILGPNLDDKKNIPSLSLDEDGLEWCPSPNKKNLKSKNFNDLKGEEITKAISVDDVQSKEFKKPELPSWRSTENKPNYSNPEPSSSSAPDFIPIKNDDDLEYGSDERLLSLRGGGDYKYSYEDIITGSFDEKLEESLLKGVSINLLNDDIDEINTHLKNDYKNMLQSNGYKKLIKFREILPTYKKAHDVMDVIDKNQVVVISGETGCGKSTQVPQLILDNAIRNGRGANVKIIVTQPRRIAASSLAMRVAQERGEKLGQSVGYAVRLEKVESRARGSIMFCTTGILLADLEVNQGLTEFSHVILDEVHERDCNVDLSMCMLKKVLQKRKDLKLILMSATIDAETLSMYFDDCPMMHIEGLAYPVEDIYLEDILQVVNFELGPLQPQQRQPIWMKKSKKNRKNMMSMQMEKDIKYRAEIGPWLESIKHKLNRQSYITLLRSDIETLNIDLVLQVLIYIVNGPPGAVLVFMPGIGEISKLMRLMDESSMFPKHLFEIHPLHSKLPSLEQHKIFEKPPDHIRKIIIATNIAETSITIDDIVYVLDSAKLKISGLSVEDNIATLKTETVSQANLRQRRGRAGRCQPGVCYHLLTSFRATKIDERVLPELQRSDLLEPVLTIKRLRLGKAAEALNMVPSPPAAKTVEWAVKHLQQCGALDDKETLTPLGWHLARLPVHPSAGKLLLLGSLFGCLDRAASVAAVWGFKDPFQLVIGKELEVDAAKRCLALGEPSDHIAISEAIIQWERCSHQRRHSFAYQNFLSNNTLTLLSDMKNQFGDSLRRMGFLSSGNVKSSWENRNADNLSLFKAIIAASLYPKIGTVRWFKGGKHGQRIKVRTTDDLGMVIIHPSSVMVRPPSFRGARPPLPLCNNPGANWLVYWLKQRSTDLFLFELTLVYSLPLLFFGELKVDSHEDDPDMCYMSISTVKVLCNKDTAEILFELRSFLDQVLASKIMVGSDHSTKHSEFEECVLKAVTQLITAEDEQADYLGDDDDPTGSDSSESESSSNWKTIKN